MKDGLPAQNRAHARAREFFGRHRAMAVAVEQLVRVFRSMFGVANRPARDRRRADRDASLSLRDRKRSRDIFGSRFVDAARAESPEVEQQRQQMLAAGDAAPDLEEIRRRSSSPSATANDRSRSCARPGEQRFAAALRCSAARAHRRRAFGHRAESLHVVLGRARDSAGTSRRSRPRPRARASRDERHARGAAHVDDVQRAAGFACAESSARWMASSSIAIGRESR